MVSIIVPVYNVRDYLDRCMNSIVNQTFKDIEIILINDGSTDKSDELCIEWQKKDDRIIYISKRNEGLGPTRNLGFNIAKGKYINFVDSDDWIEEDAIECMYNAAEKSNADIVVSDINNVYIDEDGKLISKASTLRIKSNVVIDVKKDIRLIDTARLFFCGKLYRRDFYIKNKVIQPSHAFEDSATLPLLVSKADTIFRVEKPLYNYLRGRKGSIVNNTSCYSDMIKSLQEIEKGFKEAGLFEKYYTVLRKISFSQVRFIYKRIPAKDIELLNDLYIFMDRVYPDWVNINDYSIGVLGREDLRKAIINLAFDESKIQYEKSNIKKILKNNILIIDFLNKEFYKNIDSWQKQLKENFKVVNNNIDKRQVILVKIIEDADYYLNHQQIADNLCNIYRNSNLDVSVIEVSSKDVAPGENLQWDLADEVLKKLHR